MNIPCKECLLIPVCRNKYFNTLIRSCSLISKLLYNQLKNGNYYASDNWDEGVVELHKTLNPKYWELRFDQNRKESYVDSTNVTGIIYTNGKSKLCAGSK